MGRGETGSALSGTERSGRQLTLCDYSTVYHIA